MPEEFNENLYYVVQNSSDDYSILTGKQMKEKGLSFYQFKGTEVQCYDWVKFETYGGNQNYYPDY